MVNTIIVCVCVCVCVYVCVHVCVRVYVLNITKHLICSKIPYYQNVASKSLHKMGLALAVYN